MRLWASATWWVHSSSCLDYDWLQTCWRRTPWRQKIMWHTQGQDSPHRTPFRRASGDCKSQYLQLCCKQRKHFAQSHRKHCPGTDGKPGGYWFVSSCFLSCAESQQRKRISPGDTWISLILFRKALSHPSWCGSVVECQPMNQRVAGSIPSLGHTPGLQARSPVGGSTRGNHTLMFLSLSFSPFPSKK